MRSNPPWISSAPSGVESRSALLASMVVEIALPD
jgi:hypothetical protein